jgi:hypothetical protein
MTPTVADALSGWISEVADPFPAAQAARGASESARTAANAPRRKLRTTAAHLLGQVGKIF